MVTRQGVAKRVGIADMNDVRRSGIIAIKLQAGDELLSVAVVTAGEEAIIATRGGQAIRFKVNSIREMGRAAGGVRAIKLKKSDLVVGLGIIGADQKANQFLVVSENGFGKKTVLDEYKVQGRGGGGIKTAQVTTKTGPLINAQVLDATATEIITISKQGQVIRTTLAEIPSLGRQTQGVRIMKLRTGDMLASLTCLTPVVY